MLKCGFQKEILGPVCGCVNLRKEFQVLYVEAWASERDSKSCVCMRGTQNGILNLACGCVNLLKEFRPCMWKYVFHKGIVGAIYGNVELREELLSLYMDVWISEVNTLFHVEVRT
jgi:hypothetical protein